MAPGGVRGGRDRRRGGAAALRQRARGGANRQIELAKELVDSPRATFLCSDMGGLSFDDGSFDANENTDMTQRPASAPAIDSF